MNTIKGLKRLKCKTYSVHTLRYLLLQGDHKKGFAPTETKSHFIKTKAVPSTYP